MKIEILQEPELSMASKVWDYSRPNNPPALLADVLAIDAPVNEFPSIVLAITSTIVEREVLASFRDHIMWARTSRVDDPTLFSVSEETAFVTRCRDRMVALRREGAPQDEYRLQLPLVAHCSYALKLSPRGLCLAMHAFDLLDLQNAYEEFHKLVLHFNLSGLAEAIHPTLPTLSLPPNAKSDSMQGMISAVIDAPFSLRTQAIRHRMLVVRDELTQLIVSNAVSEMSLSDKIRIQVTATTETWEKIYEKRNCWLAHYKLWGPLLAEAFAEAEFQTRLPCHSGKCPYTKDAQLRLEGRDPNPPCPQYMNMQGIKATPKQREDMSLLVYRDARPAFWISAIEETRK